MYICIYVYSYIWPRAVYIFLCIESNHLNVSVRWMPSHLQDKIDANPDSRIPDTVSLNDVIGNQWADDLAGQSATLLELPPCYHILHIL